MDALSRSISRRALLKAGLTWPCWARTLQAGVPSQTTDSPQADDRLAFFVIGDTHYFANERAPQELQAASAKVCSQLVETLNRLPGTELPESVGGGRVAEIRGVIHAGDIIDTGDKRGAVQEQMQQTEWEHYTAEFGLTGAEGRLRYPVFEVHGNHDSPGGDGLVVEGLRERVRRRKVLGRSANDLHYSWDWGPVHFINLGIVVGQDREVAQRRRYNPLESLDFLIGDLQQHVADSGKPVVITHHVDVLRYSQPCDPQNEKNLGLEWNPCDVRAYYEAIRNYNVAAIIYGHTHVRNILPWNGTAERADAGITLLNVDNSSHFSGPNQAFFYVEIDSRELLVRECLTKDGWETSNWTPQVWRSSLREGLFRR